MLNVPNFFYAKPQKKMKIAIFSMLVFLSSIPLEAQRIPVFTQARENMMLLNPAIPHLEFLFAVYGDDFGTLREYSPSNRYNQTIGISLRMQWTELGQYSPRTGLIRWEHMPELKDRKPTLKSGKKKYIIYGASLIEDDTKPIYSTTIIGRFAYRFGKVGKYGNYQFLSLGASYSANNYRFNGDPALLNNPNDPIGLDYDNRWYDAWSFGFLYEWKGEKPNHYLLGISINQAPRKISEEPVNLYYFNGLFGMINNVVNRTGPLKSFETLLNVRYSEKAPLEWTVNHRIAFHVKRKNTKERSHFFWLGLGANFGWGEPYLNGLYFDPSFVLKGGDIQYKFGFAIALYQADFIRNNFGQVPELNTNFAFGH